MDSKEQLQLTIAKVKEHLLNTVYGERALVRMSLNVQNIQIYLYNWEDLCMYLLHPHNVFLNVYH